MHMRKLWKTGMVFCSGGQVELAGTSLLQWSVKRVVMSDLGTVAIGIEGIKDQETVGTNPL